LDFAITHSLQRRLFALKCVGGHSDNKKYEEDEKQQSCDFHGYGGDTTKTQNSGNQCYHKKDKRPAKHDVSPKTNRPVLIELCQQVCTNRPVALNNLYTWRITNDCAGESVPRQQAAEGSGISKEHSITAGVCSKIPTDRSAKPQQPN